jgi:hypothetical protein
MCEETDDVGTDERHDAESGQNKRKRHKPKEQETGRYPDCDKCGEIRVTYRHMPSELRYRAVFCFTVCHGTLPGAVHGCL